MSSYLSDHGPGASQAHALVHGYDTALLWAAGATAAAVSAAGLLVFCGGASR